MGFREFLPNTYILKNTYLDWLLCPCHWEISTQGNRGGQTNL